MSTFVMEAAALLSQFDLYDALAITLSTMLLIVWNIQARSQPVDRPMFHKQKPQAPAMQKHRVTYDPSMAQHEDDLLSWEQPEEEVVGRYSRMSSQINMGRAMGQFRPQEQAMDHPCYSQDLARFSSRSIAERRASRCSGRVSLDGEQMIEFMPSMAAVHEPARFHSSSRPSQSYRLSIEEMLPQPQPRPSDRVLAPTHPRNKTKKQPAHPRKSAYIAPAPRDSAKTQAPAPSVETLAYLELKKKFM